MTGKPTDPRIAAAALRHDCPTCGAMSGMRCAVMSKGEWRHVRLHKGRTDAGRRVVMAENTARMKKAFVS